MITLSVDGRRYTICHKIIIQLIPRATVHKIIIFVIFVHTSRHRRSKVLTILTMYAIYSFTSYQYNESIMEKGQRLTRKSQSLYLIRRPEVDEINSGKRITLHIEYELFAPSTSNYTYTYVAGRLLH